MLYQENDLSKTLWNPITHTYTRYSFWNKFVIGTLTRFSNIKWSSSGGRHNYTRLEKTFLLNSWLRTLLKILYCTNDKSDRYKTFFSQMCRYSEKKLLRFFNDFLFFLYLLSLIIQHVVKYANLPIIYDFNRPMEKIRKIHTTAI